jgi:S1-C subfamily serine protease
VINDIITHINDSPINEFDQLSLFKDNNQQMHAKITINRQGQKRFLAIRLNHE